MLFFVSVHKTPNKYNKRSQYVDTLESGIGRFMVSIIKSLIKNKQK